LSKKKKKGFLERVKDSAAQQQALAQNQAAAKTSKISNTKKVVDTKPSKPSPPIEKSPEEKKKNYVEGIIKTIVPSIIGTAAAIICFNSLGSGSSSGTNPGVEVPWLSIMLFVIIFSYYAQRVLYPIIGINVKEFGAKDWFYVEFITVDIWLVVWTLLLN